MRHLKLVLPLLLTACGSAPEEELGFIGNPIIGGAAPDSPEHAAVVSLHSKYLNASTFSPSPFCSGTLIDDTWVLTAAHCVHRTKASTLAVSALDDPSTQVPFTPTKVAAVHVHSGYDPRRLYNDIALIQLQAPMPVTPVPHLPASLGFLPADVNVTNLNFAGFGYSTTAKDEDAFGIKLQADELLGGLGCTIAGCFGTPSATEIATQISYVQNPKGPCNGDSGGPAFVTRGTDVYVGGVTSYGDATCEVYGVSTNVGAYEAWIDSKLATVVPPPTLCLAKGAACTESSACCSNSCGGKPGSRTCK